MKRIEDMTDSEIVALDDATISKLIDYECAIEGAPLLPECPAPPEVIEFETDMTVFEVVGYAFKTAEEAGRVLAAFKGIQLWKIGYVPGDYSKQVLEPSDDYHNPKIETKNVFSPEMVIAKQVEMQQMKARRDEYNAAKKEYNEAFEKCRKTYEWVMGIVSEARERERKKEQLRASFNRYLELAEGNREIAIRFLNNAHTVPDGFIDELDKEEM